MSISEESTGYKSGAEDAPSDELLAEAKAMQWCSTTDGKTGGLVRWTSW